MLAPHIDPILFRSGRQLDMEYCRRGCGCWVKSNDARCCSRCEVTLGLPLLLGLTLVPPTSPGPLFPLLKLDRADGGGDCDDVLVCDCCDAGRDDVRWCGE